MDAEKVAKITGHRFEGYSPGMLALEVQMFKDGKGSESVSEAVDALKAVADSLAQTDSGLREGLREIGVSWQSTAAEAAETNVRGQSEFAAQAQTTVSDAAKSAYVISETYRTMVNKLPDPQTLRDADGGLHLGDVLGGLIGHETDHAARVQEARAAKDQAVDAIAEFQRTAANELLSIDVLASPEPLLLDDTPGSHVPVDSGDSIATSAMSASAGVAVPDPGASAAQDSQPSSGSRPAPSGASGPAVPSAPSPGAAPADDCPPETSAAAPRSYQSAGDGGSPAPSTGTAPLAPAASTGTAPSGTAPSGSYTGVAPTPPASGTGGAPVAPGSPQAPGPVSGNAPGAPSGGAVPPGGQAPAPGGSAGGSGGGGAAGAVGGVAGGGAAGGKPGFVGKFGPPGGDLPRGFAGGPVGGPVGGAPESQAPLAKGKLTGAVPPDAEGEPLPPSAAGSGEGEPEGSGISGTDAAVLGGGALAAGGLAGAASREEDRLRQAQALGKDTEVDGRYLYDFDAGERPDEQTARNAEKLEPEREQDKPEYLSEAAVQAGVTEETRVRSRGVDDVDLFADRRMVAPETIGDDPSDAYAQNRTEPGGSEDAKQEDA